MIKYTSETPQSQELLQFPRCLDRLHIGSWEIRGPWIVLDWYLWNPIKYIMISIIIIYSFNLPTYLFYSVGYRTLAIISHGLYIFHPIFKDHFFVFKEVFSENSVLMYGLYSRAAYDGASTRGVVSTIPGLV